MKPFMILIVMIVLCGAAADRRSRRRNRCKTTCEHGMVCDESVTEEEECPNKMHVKNENGECVPPETCLPNKTCGKNERLEVQCHSRDVTCKEEVTEQSITEKVCDGVKCVCDVGHVRNDDGECIPLKECVGCSGNQTTVYYHKEGSHNNYCESGPKYAPGEVKWTCVCDGYNAINDGQCISITDCPNITSGPDRGEKCEGEEEDSKPSINFYFDEKSEECLAFKYLGCGGNANNFYSLYRCQTAFGKKICKDIINATCPNGEEAEKTEQFDVSINDFKNVTLIGKSCEHDFCSSSFTCHNITHNGKPFAFCCPE